jgi:hypothetical protein
MRPVDVQLGPRVVQARLQREKGLIAKVIAAQVQVAQHVVARQGTGERVEACVGDGVGAQVQVRQRRVALVREI